MKSTVVFSWSIFSMACSDPGFAYSPQPIGPTSSLTSSPSSCRRRGRDGSLRPCHSPWQYHQQQQQQQQNHRIGYYRSWGILSALARDVNGAVSEPTTSGANSGSGQSEYIWEVYVSQPNTKHKEKGVLPPSSIIQTFISLAPSSDNIQVYPALFHKQNKQKGKGYTVRCIKRKSTDSSQISDGVNAEGGEMVSALEITNVDSVDKVYRILTEHMKLGDEINPKAYECMRCYIEGSRYLEEEDPSQAISMFNQALTASDGPTSSLLPTGSILMQRARAYRMRAANHRTTLRILVKDLADNVPSASTMKILYHASSSHPALSPSIFNRLAGDSKVQQAKFRQIRYRHDMYEFALLHAVQDSLQATQILPQNANAWLLAGECLAELRKLNESNQYYQRALEIDPSMERRLRGVMEKNRCSQEFMDAARASGFSGDTLRLALDVAA